VRVGPALAALAVCSLVLVPVGVSAADEEPDWFQWVEHCKWAKYLATRDTPIVDWTGELIGENWRANWIRAAKYILYCAPYKGDSVDKVRQAWYGSITLEGHVPHNGAPAKFGKVTWSSFSRSILFDFSWIFGGTVSEWEYAESILEDEYSPTRSRKYEIVNDEEDHKPRYWLPKEWNQIKIDGSLLFREVKKSLAPPFQDPDKAEEKLKNNPMFQAAVRLAYWVATHIPYFGLYNRYLTNYGDCASCCYYKGPAAVLLYPSHGWNCVDHAVLTVALYRAAGLPGYVVGGLLNGEGHAWTAVFVYDPDSEKWHEIFIDPTSPFNHTGLKLFGVIPIPLLGNYEHNPCFDDEYYLVQKYEENKPYGYDGLLKGLAEWLRRMIAGANLEYWKTRVRAFERRVGSLYNWRVSEGEIDAGWNAFKQTWDSTPVKEHQPTGVAVVAAIVTLIPLARRPLSSP